MTKRSREEKRQRVALTVMFSLVIFGIQLITVLISGTVVWLLVQTGLISIGEMASQGYLIILYMVTFSLLIGVLISFITSKVSLKPINALISKMNQLASGDFKARLYYGKYLRKHTAFGAVSESFNKMAEELQNTEMLRSDFINNFSHEFKTPIVSIAGFTKLLRLGNLTEEQRAEYLQIIDEESMRLAYMATNVLNLTKVENQTILTDVASYNLSEQIRSCVLLLEDKWAKKNLDLNLEFDEYMISANEELLKQVWINLIDNAVKFVPAEGRVDIRITGDNDLVSVSVGNTGSEISPENQTKIFNKFYQADESHSSEGNGIGLAIVKKITELHHGDVTVRSGNGETVFTVTLPVQPM